MLDGEAEQRGGGTEEALGAEGFVRGEDQEPAHLRRGIKGTGQRKEEERWTRESLITNSSPGQLAQSAA